MQNSPTEAATDKTASHAGTPFVIYESGTAYLVENTIYSSANYARTVEYRLRETGTRISAAPRGSV